MHGGDIYSCKIEYDFSVNLNPFMPTDKIKEAARESANYINRYPCYDLDELYEKLSLYLKIDRKYLVITNGASEGITSVVRVIKPDTGVIFEPAFYGYERALKASETLNICHISQSDNICDGRQELIEVNGGKTLFFFASPSNPEGIQYTKAEICEIYEKIKSINGYLLLDECFINLSDDRGQSMISDIINNPEYFDRLIILRSFTKTFSIPGLRLGYIVCSNEEFLKRISINLPEWNISVPAMITGIACLDDEYHIDTEYLKREREYLITELTDMGIIVSPSNSIYILFKALEDLKDRLIERGILIRDCSDYYGLSKGYFRIAVKKHEENEILINEIKKIYMDR